MLLTGWNFDIDLKLDKLREVDLVHADREACSKIEPRFKVGPSQFCNFMNDIVCRGVSGSSMSKPVEYLGKQMRCKLLILLHFPLKHINYCFFCYRKSVRLGEHDRSTNPDCKTFDLKEKCLPSVEDIEVERVVVHENYNVPLRANDIALLKLSRKVEFKGKLIN